MSVKVNRKIQRSLYQFVLKPAVADETCILCLQPAAVEYEALFYCVEDGAEKFADDLFHAKVYAKTIGAHS